jgi:citrate lyase subunit beta/citryl-CoA lyase
MDINHVLRRSLLGIPANEEELIADAVGSAADEVFFDLEDSLPPAEKDTARLAAIEATRKHEWDETILSYRINGTDTRWWYEDVIELTEAVGDRLDNLIVPKVETPSDVKTITTLLDSLETNIGLSPGSIGVTIQIETSAGMTHIADIVQASDRLNAVAFGPADYTTSLGANPMSTNYPGHYWHYPLSRIAHAAASENLLAIGGLYTEGRNPSEFEETCTFDRALGYDGKFVAHPEHVETTNDIFAPDIEEAQRARQIVEQYDSPDVTNINSIDGNVIDEKMYQRAKQILSKADKAGVL